MKKFRKKTKGVISVFLIIIFLSTYLLTGLLVDGGRLHMAKVMAETALDSAGNSVLSHYNKLVYDLYGLLATDPKSVTEGEIQTLFESYVNDTLKSAGLDYEDLGIVLSDSIFDGYDFETTVSAGKSLSLGSVENVEYQIIEHMKYRAPLEMTAGAGGFLKKLEQVIKVKDRIQAAKEKIELTNTKKDFLESCVQLKQEINDYIVEVRAYAANPTENQPAMDIGGIINDFDEDIGQIESNIREEYPEEDYVDDSHDNEDYEEELEAYDEMITELIREEWDRRTEDLQVRFTAVSTGAGPLAAKADELVVKIDKMQQEYKVYIGELEAKRDSKPGSEDYKTVFGPEVELAKGNCGEILKNLELLGQAQDCFHFLEENDATNAVFELSCVMRDMMAPVDGVTVERKIQNTMDANIRTGKNYNYSTDPAIKGYCANAYDVVDALEKRMVDLEETSERFTYVKDAVLPEKVDTDKAKQKIEKKREGKGAIGDLNEADLLVERDLGLPDGDEMCQIDAGNLDAGNVTEVMDQGMNILDAIFNALEGARDSIYVNEYLLTTFPNVVHHRNMDKPEIAAKLSEAPYSDYSASLAEVEYVLTGDPVGESSVLNVEARLLGIRTILNVAAIFTDSGKISQANVLAASISGPLAPVVSIVLLIAWAVAESVMDVMALMDGEEVAFFKQGSDWNISLEGVIGEVVDRATDYLVDVGKDAVLSAVEDYSGKAQTVVNQAIYDVYDAAGSGVDQAAAIAEDKVDEWIGNNDIPELNEANQALKTEMNGALEESREYVKDWVCDSRAQAVAAVSRGFEKASEAAEEKITGAFNRLGEDVKTKLKGKITATVSKYNPGELDGDITGSTGIGAVKLDYLDYMRVFLLFMDQEEKVMRIQSLVQANMRHGGQDGFLMSEAYTGVWADMDCTIDFMFMSNPIVPSDLKQDGRLKFTVHSSRTY